jgi:hypothetical protein
VARLEEFWHIGPLLSLSSFLKIKEGVQIFVCDFFSRGNVYAPIYFDQKMDWAKLWAIFHKHI